MIVVNRRIMAVYANAGGEIVGIVSSLATNVSATLAPLFAGTGLHKPRVAYDPAIRGWLVTYDAPGSANLGMQAATADGSPINLAYQTTWPASNTLQTSGKALVCPAPASAPCWPIPLRRCPAQPSLPTLPASTTPLPSVAPVAPRWAAGSAFSTHRWRPAPCRRRTDPLALVRRSRRRSALHRTGSE